MSFEVRAAAPEEVLPALRPIWLYFGSAPAEERATRVTSYLEPGRMHAAFEDGEPVGGAGAFSFELTVPGGRVPAAGVTVVGVMPTHRRRGVLTAMMRAQLDDVHRRREPVAYLWASEAAIYRRFGYGMASLCGEVDLLRTHAAFAAPAPEMHARIIGTDEARDIVPRIYDAVAAVTPGMFGRSRAWWEGRVLDDPEWRRAGSGELMCVVVEGDGEPAAYGLYRINSSFADGSSTAVLEVTEAMGATPAATASLWRYLLDVDWMERLHAGLLPVDHPLFLLLAEPRRMRFRVGDALWVRLVDVAAALGSRGYAAEDALVLEVRDGFCPWNDGRWRIESGGAARTTAPADLALDVADLASLYLGGFTWAELGRSGRIDELSQGAVARADALFRTDRAPWCPEIF
jgi:predicted acetyltransferase